MKIDVKFTEATFPVKFDNGERLNADFRNLYEIKDGYTQAELDKAVGDATANGIEQGKQAEYDRFWDAYQQNGNKTDYDQAFAYNHWSDAILRPKHPLKFEGSNGGRQVFTGCKALTEINVPIYAKNTRMVYTFQNCAVLKTIALLHLEGVTDFSNCFGNCAYLESVTIGGSIDKNIAFAQSDLLTTASVQSIIDHLKDLTGQTAQTIQFHTDVLLRLTEEQIATILAKNWTI